MLGGKAMVLKRVFAAVVSGAVLVWMAGPASANNVWTQTAQTAFSECDGFGMPSSGGDGMTGYAMIWGLFNPPGYGTTAKSASSGGGSGVAACDAALADDHLLPAYWMRKVNLLKARALHHLESGETDAALSDLDLALAAVQDSDDVFYQRSLGVGLDIVRGMAVSSKGDPVKGEALARQAWARRPWTRLTGYSAVTVFGSDMEKPENLPVMQGLARLQPTLLNEVFISAYDAGRWSEVVALYPQMPTPKRQRTFAGGYGTFTMDYVARVEDEIFWASHAGADAFALAALGRAAEAKTAYDRKIAENQRITTVGGANLDKWTKLVERRIAADQAPVADLLAGLATDPLPRGAMGLSVVGAIAARLPAGDAAGHAVLEAARAKLAEPPRPTAPRTPSELFKSLPDAETVKRLTRYQPKNNNFWTGNGDGFTVAPMKSPETWGITDPDVVAVNFRGVASPASVVEEMALLKAAELARSKGLKGFIILSRRDIEHTISATQYGMVLRTDPAGYETELDLVLVDPAALPEKYRGVPWRVVDADAVWNDLSPIYVRADDPKGGKKAK